MEKLSLEQLRQELEQEGSLNQYDMYLAGRYGPQFFSSLFTYSMEQAGDVNSHYLEGNRAAKGFLNTYGGSRDQEACLKCSASESEFFLGAMAEDLKRKELAMLYKIAEAEKEFTDRPYLRAIDIYYKLNLLPGLSQEEVNDKVQAFESNVREDR